MGIKNADFWEFEYVNEESNNSNDKVP
jgi:hypothetical protein